MLPEDESRYSRQIKLPQIGEQGQRKILDSRALIVGMGGLGSPATLYLATAGIGGLFISDFTGPILNTCQIQIWMNCFN